MSDPIKVFIFGDVVVPTGFGRIGAAIGQYLVARGYAVMGADIQYDGLLPHPLPFWCSPLAGRDGGQGYAGFVGTGVQVIRAWQPDLVVSIQDFPYHEALRQHPGLDWSGMAHIIITPIDGVPVYTAWVDTAKKADGFMTISEFGVKALKDAGVRADLCPPGVDTVEFHRLPDDERADLRGKLSIPAGAFMVGMMAMNQGRKDFPGLIEGWWQALKDIPEAFLYLDCDKTSPAGWDIPKQLLGPLGVDAARVRFREDAFRAGMMQLNQRYNLLDLHGVIAHREGYGLPHGEAAATGCPTMAIDYCSGREVAGENGERGALVKAMRGRFGTWGGAYDYHADIDDLAQQIRFLYDHPEERKARGARALEWAKGRTWERTGAAVLTAVERVLEARKADIDKRKAQPVQPPAVPPLQANIQPAGIAPVINVNGPIVVQGTNAQDIAAQIAAQVGQQVTLLEGEKVDEAA